MAFELLRLGPKLAIIDEDLFRYFVSNLDPTEFTDIFLKKNNQKPHSYSTQWSEFLSRVVESCIYYQKKKVTELIEKYLTLICEKHNSLDSCSDLNLRQTVTKRIIRETRILSTKDGLESLDDVEVAPEHFKMV